MRSALKEAFSIGLTLILPIMVFLGVLVGLAIVASWMDDKVGRAAAWAVFIPTSTLVVILFLAMLIWTETRRKG